MAPNKSATGIRRMPKMKPVDADAPTDSEPLSFLAIKFAKR
jgi:hypothetical protein